MTRKPDKPTTAETQRRVTLSNVADGLRVNKPASATTDPALDFSGRQLVEFNEAVDSLKQAAIPPAEMPEMVERVFGRGQRIYGRIELDAAVFDAVLFHAETLAEESENNHGNGPTNAN